MSLRDRRKDTSAQGQPPVLKPAAKKIGATLLAGKVQVTPAAPITPAPIEQPAKPVPVKVSPKAVTITVHSSPSKPEPKPKAQLQPKPQPKSPLQEQPATDPTLLQPHKAASGQQGNWEPTTNHPQYKVALSAEEAARQHRTDNLDFGGGSHKWLFIGIALLVIAAVIVGIRWYS